MKKLMWFLSSVSLIGTAVAMRFMPDRVPMHFDISGNIDRWGSKYELFIFPAVIILNAVVTAIIIRNFEKKVLADPESKESAGMKSNAGVIGIAGAVTSAVLVAIQGFMMYKTYSDALPGAAKQAVDMSKMPALLIGVILIILGNFMTKTRLNRFIGFRTKWSMYNDVTWEKSNRFASYLMIAAGVLSIVCAFILKSYTASSAAAVALVVIAGIVTAVYSHKIYKEETAPEKGEE